MKTQHALLVLALALTACEPAQLPATPTAVSLSRTATSEPPTATVAPPTETPVPPPDTPQPTATIQPQVWEIWFSGYPCEDSLDCFPVPGLESKVYSINNDGTDLRELSITEFPPTPALPEIAPSPEDISTLVAPPQFSPDGSKLVYLGTDRKLYIADQATGQVISLFDARPDNAFAGPYCWEADGSRIRFLEMGRNSNLIAPIMYSVKPDGSDLQRLFDLPGMKSIWFGVCSPNGHEMAVSIPYGPDKEQVGLHIVNVHSGEVHHVLANFSVWNVQVASDAQ